jgi:hypothetical protein
MVDDELMMKFANFKYFQKSKATRVISPYSLPATYYVELSCSVTTSSSCGVELMGLISLGTVGTKHGLVNDQSQNMAYSHFIIVPRPSTIPSRRI